MSNMKKIVFIPPNGKMFINDFSIQRLGEHFKSVADVHTTLITIDIQKAIKPIENIDSIISVASKDELFEQLKLLEYDVIFHRSWMLAYPFAAELVKNFPSVIVNIKDWNFSTKKEYKIIFGDKAAEDFEAIRYIFQNTKLVLSHFTKEQAKIWAKKYNVNEKKFIFFPEYCNEKNFSIRENTTYQTPKLVFAGSLGPTSYPEEFFLAKSHLRAIREITKHNIDVSYVLTAGAYAGTQSPRQRLLFQDILYENTFNEKFHLIEGETLNPSILNKYHFGFFNLEYTTKSESLNKYAIPSKFAFYLEAGIPMIINSKLKSLSKIIDTYKLGIVISNKELESLDKILNKITSEEYSHMQLNIEKFRDHFTYSNNINQLL